MSELTGTLKKIGEKWKPLIDAENRYLISNLGRIYSLERVVNNNGGKMIKKGSLLTPYIDNGYYKINLINNNGIRKTLLLHRVIAKNWIANYSEDLKVNHIDANKLNNRVENLEMVSQRENMSHYYGFLNDKSVGIYKRRNRWVSNISVNDKTIYLGSFVHKEDAIKARKDYEISNNIINKYLKL